VASRGGEPPDLRSAATQPRFRAAHPGSGRDAL